VAKVLRKARASRRPKIDPTMGEPQRISVVSRLMKNSIRAADDATLKEGEPSAPSPRLAVFGEYGSAASPSFIRLGIYPLGIALATKRVLHQPVRHNCCNI
jgi:hypothetical protein